jgi:hypothetical protein
MKTYTATIGVYVRAYTDIEFEAESDDARRDWGHARDYVEGMWLKWRALHFKALPAIVSISDEANDFANGIDFSLSKEDTIQLAAWKLLIALNSMISIFEESTTDWEDDSPGMAVMNEARALVAELLG